MGAFVQFVLCDYHKPIISQAHQYFVFFLDSRADTAWPAQQIRQDGYAPQRIATHGGLPNSFA